MRTKLLVQRFAGRATVRAGRFVVSLFILTLQSMGQAPTSVRIADVSCARCHADIYNRYLATPMANASGAASGQPHPASTVRSGSGVEYTFANDASAGKASLRSSH